MKRPRFAERDVVRVLVLFGLTIVGPATAADIAVWVYLVPPAESPPLYGNQYSEPFQLDYLRRGRGNRPVIAPASQPDGLGNRRFLRQPPVFHACLRTADAVAWEQDVPGGTPAWEPVEVDVSRHVHGKTGVRLSFRLIDKRGVSNFGVRWRVSELQTQGLRLKAKLSEPRTWQVSRQGTFETGFGAGAAGQLVDHFSARKRRNET